MLERLIRIRDVAVSLESKCGCMFATYVVIYRQCVLVLQIKKLEG